MAIIKRKDVLEVDAILSDLKSIRTEIDLLTKSMKGLHQEKRSLNDESTGSNAKKAVDLTKQLETQTQKLAAAQTKEAKTLAELRVKNQEQNKLLKEQARESLGLVSAYGKLTKRTNEAQKRFKDLAAQYGVASKQAQKARKEFDKLDAQLRQVNNAAKDGRRDVGRYGTALQGVGRQLLGATGIVGGATLLVSAIGNGIKVFKDFEKSASKLAAIIGKSKNEIAALTEQAKQLGATTAFTASEVISLQTELAKLGFSLKEIEDSTPGILDLAAATGADLASSAELAGATLRIFNLDASEMSRVTDVLAKSTTISSLSMEKLATIMPTVGKTAQIAGVSLEETAALAGTLTDRGLDASTAATSLRNIFLELSNKGLTWNEAMEKINKSTDRNKTAMDIFGKRAASAGIILSETAESTSNLTMQLNEAEGAANQMAETMLDNLAGDITKAQSAWEGFILSLEDGNGIISLTFRAITQTGTGILTMLTALNNEYANSAIKAQEMSNAAADVIPFWETQLATIELLLPALKKAREETERIANLRAKNIKGIQNENKQLKTFIFQQEVLNGQQASEVTNLIRTLRFKAQKEKLNKVENALLDAAVLKLQEYNKFIALSSKEDEKAATSKKKLNFELEGQNKELEQAREEYERLIELQKRAAAVEGVDLIETRTTDTQVQQTEIAPIAGGFFSPIAVDEAKNLTSQINESIEEENEARRKRELEKELAFQEAKKELADSFLEQTFAFASDIASTNTQERLSEIEANAEAEKQILQQRLDDGLISEGEFRQKVAEIDKKARQDAAKAEKRGALFQIGIDTAAAVVKALGSAPPPFNFINAGLVAAQAAIQAALVAAKPLPAFADGVIGFKGKGTAKSDSNIAKISNGESVITAEGTNNAPLTLDAINRGLLSDTDINNGMSNNQKDSLLASLLMQGNKQNESIINALGFLGFVEERDGFATVRMGNGTVKKYKR